MKTYTVILLRPDYVADEFGKDTYMSHVEALDVAAAERRAQEEAFAADDACGDHYPDLDDYFVIAVIEGKHMDIKTS